MSIQDGTATALRMRRTPQRSTQIRSAASGRVLWSTENIGFEPVPRELLEKTTSEIRTRKGMKPEPYDANYYAG